MENKTPPLTLYRHRGISGDMLDAAKVLRRLSQEIEAAHRQEVWHSPIKLQKDPFDTNPNFVDSSGKEIKDFMKEFRSRFGTYAGFHYEDYRDEARRTGVSVSKIRKLRQNTEFIEKVTILYTLPIAR